MDSCCKSEISPMDEAQWLMRNVSKVATFADDMGGIDRLKKAIEQYEVCQKALAASLPKSKKKKS